MCDAGVVVSCGSLSRSSLAAPCSPPALLLGAATSGRRVCKTFVLRTLPTSRDLLDSRRKTLKPLSSPALQNQLQVFAGPVRQKTVSVLAEEMYPLTTTNTGHGHDSSVRGNRVREHQCGSALRSSLPSTPPSPGHRPGVCPARCCGPASQAEAGRVAPAPLDTVNSREPRRTLAFPPRLDAVNSPRGNTSRPASPWCPVPTQQPQGRHEQCRAGGKRKLKGAEGRSWCAMPALL